ncbi:GNAT family N-acetyltransferase [Flavobacterium agricola]|uniref:GNAT family N-acetyltransferase n=2 Tax=Flavobacterium agricola TaxID=2870839 RepID=A0ABY6M3S3_9FLAO|nr:GNAT family N-acetyltransferase [Flavobacterium agricola]
MTNFDINVDYILENDFVKLIPLQENHFHDLLYFTENEPEIWEYTMVKANTPDNLKKYISAAIEARIKQQEYAFIVYDKMQNKFAGATRFCDINLGLQKMQMGYTWYGKHHQGTGINKHCKYLLLDFCFETMHMERLEFRCYTENERSINALKSIGCTIEGVIRSNAIAPNGLRRDSMVLSILKHEWHFNVKTMLQNKLYSTPALAI